MDAIYRQTDRRVQEEEKAKTKSSALLGGVDSFSVKETSSLLDAPPGGDHASEARPQPKPITIQ